KLVHDVDHRCTTPVAFDHRAMASGSHLIFCGAICPYAYLTSACENVPTAEIAGVERGSAGGEGVGCRGAATGQRGRGRVGAERRNIRRYVAPGSRVMAAAAEHIKPLRALRDRPAGERRP